MKFKKCDCCHKCKKSTKWVSIKHPKKRLALCMNCCDSCKHSLADPLLAEKFLITKEFFNDRCCKHNKL